MPEMGNYVFCAQCGVNYSCDGGRNSTPVTSTIMTSERVFLVLCSLSTSCELSALVSQIGLALWSAPLAGKILPEMFGQIGTECRKCAVLNVSSVQSHPPEFALSLRRI